jgi:hypothetical protein
LFGLAVDAIGKGLSDWRGARRDCRQALSDLSQALEQPSGQNPLTTTGRAGTIDNTARDVCDLCRGSREKKAARVALKEKDADALARLGRIKRFRWWRPAH